MRRASARLCDAALARQWLHGGGDPAGGPRLRVMHFNVLADCLAKSSPLLGAKRGFRCDPQALTWETRRELIKHELLRYNCDIFGLCEVDHYEDFFEPELEPTYSGFFRRKRSPAQDGVAVFWRRQRLHEALRKWVFLDRYKGPGSQVALLQRLHVPDGSGGLGRNVVVCAAHLRAGEHAGEVRLHQAAEIVSALADFARGDPQIVLADVNSAAPAPGYGQVTAATTVFEYFRACGYRCAYHEVSESASAHGSRVQGTSFPAFTTWAGWATGDFRSVCDHIFISGGLRAVSVLDAPCERMLAETFHERLPNEKYPSDHISLVADLVFTS